MPAPDAYYDPNNFEIHSDPYPAWNRRGDDRPLSSNDRYDS